MKRTLAILFAGIMIFFASGCNKNEPASDSPADIKEELPAEPEENEFYKAMQTNFRPIAVMIDNDDYRARPQLGLESAYMVYEIVVEGGATRFMALFNNAHMEKVGPVRSARHYFLDYALEHDARYVHAGWSDKAAAEIKSRGVDNINGITESIFWRDKTYDNTWHNLYTGLDKAEELADKKGYRNTTTKKPFEYLKNFETPNGTDALYLSVPYANFYEVEFKYNADTQLYERYVNGKAHMSQTGEALTAKNIIVYSLINVPLNDGIYAPRQDVKNVGSGEGYYLSQGKAVKLTWSKPDRSSVTEYTLENGEKLKLNPGNTYVQIAPEAVGYTIK